jgi:hypothetical protein
MYPLALLFAVGALALLGAIVRPRSRDGRGLSTACLEIAENVVAGAFVLCCARAMLFVFGVPSDPTTTLGSVAVILAAGRFATRKAARATFRAVDAAKPIESGRTGSRTVRLLGAVVLGAVVLGAVVAAALLDCVLLSPSAAVLGDELLIWMQHAKVYANASTPDQVRSLLHTEFWPNAPSFGRAVMHPDYPSFVPILAGVPRALFGDVADGWFRLPAHALWIAHILMIFGVCTSRLPGLRGVALFSVVATGSFDAEQRFLMADVAVSLGALMAANAVAERFSEGDVRSVFALAIGLATAIWSKNEGAMLAGAVVFGALFASTLTRRPIDRSLAVAFCVAPLGLAVRYAANSAFGVRTDLLGGEEGRPLWTVAIERGVERVPDVARRFGADVVADPAAGGWLMVAAAAVAIFSPRTRRRAAFLAPLLSGAACIVGLSLVFLGTFHDLDWHWRTAGVRVFRQILPLFGVCLAYAPVLQGASDASGRDDAASPRRRTRGEGL